MSQFVPFNPATAPPPIPSSTSSYFHRQCKPAYPSPSSRRYTTPRITAMLKPDSETPLILTPSLQPLLRVSPLVMPGAFPCRLSATPDTTLLPSNKMALTAEEYAALPNYINIPRPALQLLSKDERQLREGEGLLDLPGDALDWDTLLGAGKENEEIESLSDKLIESTRMRIYSIDSGYRSRVQSCANSTSEEEEEERWMELEEILSTAVTGSSVSELEEEGSDDASFWNSKRQIGDLLDQEVSLMSVSNALAERYMKRLPELFQRTC